MSVSICHKCVELAVVLLTYVLEISRRLTLDDAAIPLVLPAFSRANASSLHVSPAPLRKESFFPRSLHDCPPRFHVLELRSEQCSEIWRHHKKEIQKERCERVQRGRTTRV